MEKPTMEKTLPIGIITELNRRQPSKGFKKGNKKISRDIPVSLH